MNRNKTWLGGLGLSAPCVIVTLAMTPALDPTSSGQVHGRVTYNGRPLQGGFILIEPIEGGPNDWALAAIERDGQFALNSKWRKGKHRRERFRIGVVSNNSQPVAHMPSQNEGASPDDTPMSLGSQEGSSDGQTLGVKSGFPERFMNAKTSGLHVTLGSEPACVDIDLKD